MAHPLSLKLISSVYFTLYKFIRSCTGRVRLLLAVSGGSDSIALLHILYSLKEKLKVDLFVVTVNHNIRDEKVSKEDAEFVKKLCLEGFSEKIECLVIEIPKNKIKDIATKRKKGMEEAARFVRYKAFDKAKKLFNADYVLTAHTKDDFYEGILMSFFRGSSLLSLIGMQEKRDKYIKPLLNIEKKELKSYLESNGIKWKEDATNTSFLYLRNKVRHLIFPSLDFVFSGWRCALDKTIKKLSIDASYISSSYNNYLKTIQYWKKNKSGGISACSQEFLLMPYALKMRFLQEGFILLGVKKRVSSSFLLKSIYAQKKDFPVQLNGLSFSIQDSNIVLELLDNEKEENAEKKEKEGYLIWVNKIQKVLIGDSFLHMEMRSTGIFIFSEKDRDGIGPFHFPFCIRSRLQGDVIKIKGKEKKIKSLLRGAHLLSNSHTALPIVEEMGRIKALYGGLIGVKSFIGD